MTSFYVLEPEEGILFGTKWAYAEQVDPVVRGEAEKCPVCGAAVGGLRWLPPHRIRLSSAKPEKWGDFVWGAGFLLLVSSRFKAIYEAEGLSGVTVFYPAVEIVGGGKRRGGDLPPDLPNYHLIEIVWNGANQDDEASELVREVGEGRTQCSYCRVHGVLRRRSGIVIEEGSWTGVDVFSARGAPGLIIVSERFGQVVERYGLKNAWLIPAEKYAYDDRRPGLWYVRGEFGPRYRQEQVETRDRGTP